MFVVFNINYENVKRKLHDALSDDFSIRKQLFNTVNSDGS